MTNAPFTTESRRVWDLFVRVFHWTLVLAVALNYFVLESGKTLHQWTGYAAAALVLARVVWGFIGSPYARFSNFFPTPTRLREQWTSALADEPPKHWGHNPTGALMMLALMALVLALGVTGWMQGLDAFWGDEWLEDTHGFLANALMALAGLHAAAALVVGRLERTRLVKAMVTGVKERW